MRWTLHRNGDVVERLHRLGTMLLWDETANARRRRIMLGDELAGIAARSIGENLFDADNRRTHELANVWLG
jgi:hypothetical protein